MKTKEAADGRLFFCDRIVSAVGLARVLKRALQVRLRTYEQDGELLKRPGLVIWPVSSPVSKNISIPV